jgi:hypothetical protein
MCVVRGTNSRRVGSIGLGQRFEFFGARDQHRHVRVAHEFFGDRGQKALRLVRMRADYDQIGIDVDCHLMDRLGRVADPDVVLGVEYER